MPEQSPKPEPARDHGTELRILNAARSVFVRRGTAGARMQEIAAEAGVNPALLHYYFRSKDRLAQAVFHEAAGRLVPAVARLLTSELTLEQKVEQVVHLYIDTIRETPFLPGYILSELHHHPERLTTIKAGLQPHLAQLPQALVQRLGAQLEAQAVAGAVRPIAPIQFVVSLLGLLVVPFIARPMLESAFGMDDQAFERFLDERRAELPGFILNALRP